MTASASMSDCPVTVRVGLAVSRTQSSSSRSNGATIRSASSSFFTLASSSSFFKSTSCTFLISATGTSNLGANLNVEL